MDKTYRDFVERMGSFELDLDVDLVQHSADAEGHLSHYGVLGMKWGHRKKESDFKNAKDKAKYREQRDKDFKKLDESARRTVDAYNVVTEVAYRTPRANNILINTPELKNAEARYRKLCGETDKLQKTFKKYYSDVRFDPKIKDGRSYVDLILNEKSKTYEVATLAGRRNENQGG